MIELKAFVGILYLLGVSKGNDENIRNLWSDGPMARPVFKATMSVNRFEIIRCHLRFDLIDTGEERRARDKFAPFRELWNVFESKCRENYKHQQKFASTNNSFHFVDGAHFDNTCPPNQTSMA